MSDFHTGQHEGQTPNELGLRVAARLTGLAHRANRRLAEERGQTAAEYIGLIAVIAAGILAIQFTDLGEAMQEKMVEAIEAIEIG